MVFKPPRSKDQEFKLVREFQSPEVVQTSLRHGKRRRRNRKDPGCCRLEHKTLRTSV